MKLLEKVSHETMVFMCGLHYVSWQYEEMLE